MSYHPFEIKLKGVHEAYVIAAGALLSAQCQVTQGVLCTIELRRRMASAVQLAAPAAPRRTFKGRLARLPKAWLGGSAI
jgi:hypothetical protein